MKLVAIAEISEDRMIQAKTEHRPQFAFNDYREMLDKVDLDAVYVITHPDVLLPIVSASLQRNVHTSIEKPPGMNIGETRQMLAEQHRSGAKAIVSFNRRYIPEVLAARILLQESGGAVQVAAGFHKPPADPDWRITSPPEIVSDAIHHVDLLRWLASPTATEAAVATEVLAQSWYGEPVGTPRYNAIATFDSGCRGVMMCQYGVGYRVQTAEAHAENMSIYLDLTATPKVTIYQEERLCDEPLDLDAVGGEDFDETRHFADCILDDTGPWSSLDDAVRTMELCEAIERGVRGPLTTAI